MTKNRIKSVENTDEEVNYKLKDLKMSQLIPNIIDNYLVTILDGHHTIIMPSNITGMQFKAWSQGKGGIFSKDVLKHALNKKTPKYILFKTNELNCIIRIIEEDEQEYFESLKLIDGKIKDKPYMILKNLRSGEKLSNTNRYIDEKDIIHEDDMQISISDTQKIPRDDESSDDSYVKSISLFNE
jgi:hypothetical protein